MVVNHLGMTLYAFLNFELPAHAHSLGHAFAIYAKTCNLQWKEPPNPIYGIILYNYFSLDINFVLPNKALSLGHASPSLICQVPM